MIKIISKSIILLLLILTFLSCSDDNAGANALNLKVESASSAVSRSVAVDTGVVITDFRIAIKQIEFKMNDDINSSAGDVVFEGPFILDLLDPTNPLQQTIGSTNIAAGVYTGILFKMHKTTDDPLTAPASDHPLYDRSVYIAGTINGTNFEFYHDPSGEIMISNTNGITITSNGTANVVIRFNLLSLLDADATIDMGTATDNSGDSFIDISANSVDGDNNKSLADDLKNNLIKIADSYTE